jgi:hypothetical protein
MKIEGVDKAVDAVKARLQKLKEGSAVFFAANETRFEVIKRVEVGGLTDGGTIKYKQDYEVYAYTPPSPKKVSGKGKPYKQWKRPPVNVKGNAAKIKGGYYPTYLDYKDQQGRKDTPFDLTSRLRKSYLGNDSLFKDGPTGAFIQLTGENAGKYQGLTASKGAFLQLNQKEIDFYNARLLALLL